mgnify:CR=1 FL=1|tara:strand:- start:7351 stop:8544 length:1194 start_codon:yes stop_codon:yes gene_type:complete
MRILIVEDSEAEAFLIKSLFRNTDIFADALVHVADIDVARRHLQNGDFDIALIDHFLGAETGTSLIRDAGGRKCTTPMILMSGHGTQDVESEALNAGAMNYIDKRTLSSEVLNRTVRFTLKNHEQVLQAKANELYHREIALQVRMSNEIALQARMSSEDKAHFVATLSHEIRTPLNAIIGFSEAIQERIFGEIQGPGVDRYNGYIDDIHRSSQHLLKLINDLLDLSLLEAGRFEIELEDISLHDVIDDVLLMTLMQASEKNIAVEFDIPASLPEFCADSRLLAQVLINLLANGIKFTPVGGQIILSARLDARRLSITVEDNGPGIPECRISRLTSPCFQTPKIVDKPDRGTGLGLSVSKSIMETHLGGLTIESGAEGGTKATVWLPINLDTLNNRPN